MSHFEFVSKYANCGLNLPVRKTELSAGQDFQVAEDIIIPPYATLMDNLITQRYIGLDKPVDMKDLIDTPITLGDMAKLAKRADAKPTLVPTGVKAVLAPDEYLELSVRSSCPLKHWLVLANGVGIIDSDQIFGDTEGHIFFQIINLSPFPIMLKKNECIGQGIIKKYGITDNDVATGKRVGGLGSTGG